MLNKLVSIVFILLAGICSAQKPMIQLIVDPKVSQVGEEITVKVISNIGGNINIDLPASFIQGGTSMSGSESEYDGNTGKLTMYFYISNVGIIKKEGNYTFGPAYIKKDRKLYKSNSVSVKINRDEPISSTSSSVDFSPKQLKKPAFGIIEKSKSKIYEGEPLVLVAKVFARYKPTHIEGYEPFEMEGVIEKHDINSVKDPEIKTIKGIEYFCFEANKQVFFPSGTGRFHISPFRMNLKKGFDGFDFASASSTIDVLPLPPNAPKNFSGGVGKFSLEKKISKSTYKQGDFIEMTLIVSGEGNLHMLSAPQFNLPKELVIYGDPIIVEDFAFGTNGSQGSISYKYNIQLKEGGNINFPQISFSYFDIVKKEYIEVKKDLEKMSISSNVKIALPKIPNTNIIKKEDILYTPSSKIGFSSKKNKGFNTSFYLLLITIPIAFSLIIIVLKKRKVSNGSNLELELNNKELKLSVIREMQLAELSLKDNDLDKFYASLQKSIFLTCLNSFGGNTKNVMSKIELYTYLERFALSNDLIDEIKFIFQSCEEARFGLVNDSTIQFQLLQRTKVTVEELMKLLMNNNC